MTDPRAVTAPSTDPAYEIVSLRKALAHSNRPGRYCEGGSLICEHCVGSCGVEEHDELVEDVLHDEALARGGAR